jgi:hypothetical protein
MTTLRITRAGFLTAVALATLAIFAVVPAGHIYANEAKGDLALQLRLVETSSQHGRVGPSMTAVARIEVFVEAFRATKDIRLSVLRPDGSTWKVKGRRFSTGTLDWTDPTGEPQEAGGGEPSIPAHGAIRTMIAVPLEGAAIHEIVVTATGLVEGQPVKTEGVVRAALGVPDNQPVDDGVHANFALQEVK